ncbi:MAG: UvrD-helicase domain-containing protein [Candidatus Spechtbacteria bacterium]|nr:UvrD-helicase domain-containing protein [Candidatus Spechtbacteria bacterium]
MIDVMDILTDLNPKQREAVEAISGPVLVVAGPGSGKTKTLTHRIAHLVQKGVDPTNILALTFTNKAADEIKLRVSRLLTHSGRPWLGTFHSVCARILRSTARYIGHTPDFTIYDEDDSLDLVKSVMRKLSIEQKQWSPAKIRAIISSAKNELQNPEDYEIAATDHFSKLVSKVYALYQKQLTDQNALDFDDILTKTIQLFEQNPRILEHYQTQFKYVLVDEFQDTNAVQYKIANLLAQKHGNLYCIGDLDQSIYSFRGADYRNILYFEKDWPTAKVITLEQNYRSTQNILDVAHAIISQNSNRKEKRLWTENGKGEDIVVKEVETERDEGDFIVSELERLVREKHLRLCDFVVLYRTNAQSRAIEESFLRNGFPYKIIGGIRFFQRKEVKDLLSWLKICLNPNDALALERASAMPARFLQQKLGSKIETVMLLTNDFSQKSKTLKLPEFLEYVIEHTGFEQYVRDGTEKGDERWDNVRGLLSVSLKYESEEPEVALRSLLQEAALAQETDTIAYEKDLTNLMTLHSVKGLEFPVVFIAGCEQGLLPHSRALFGANFDDIEEERRLCYVGVTRAKQKLYLLFARQRTIFGKIQSNPPSQFLQNLPEHLITFIPAEEETIIELD